MLELIKALTKRMEGRLSEYTTNSITNVYDALALILKQLEKLKQQYYQSPLGMAFQSAIEHAQAKANEYYTKLKRSLAYTTTLMFNLHRKLELLKRNQTANKVKRCLVKVQSIQEYEYPYAVTPIQVLNSPLSSQASSQERTPLSLLNHN